jgi:hypothetical protein
MVILPILEAAFSKVVGRWWGNDSGVESICLVLFNNEKEYSKEGRGDLCSISI